MDYELIKNYPHYRICGKIRGTDNVGCEVISLYQSIMWVMLINQLHPLPLSLYYIEPTLWIDNASCLKNLRYHFDDKWFFGNNSP